MLVATYETALYPNQEDHNPKSKKLSTEHLTNLYGNAAVIIAKEQ
jgi:hypothetical protein